MVVASDRNSDDENDCQHEHSNGGYADQSNQSRHEFALELAERFDHPHPSIHEENDEGKEDAFTDFSKLN